MKKGYEQTYEWVIGLLKDCDFAESAARLKVPLTAQDTIEIRFLDRTYCITKDAIALIKEEKIWKPKSEGYEYNLKSVLGYYVLSPAEVEPVNDFCTLGHFSHGIFGKSISEKDALSRVFGQDYAEFRGVAETLGMVFEGEKSSGQYVWRYTLLPKMPVKMVYYEGDDEFPTKIQVLYDKTAIQVYKFEPLAVLHICFIEGLAAIGAQT